MGLFDRSAFPPHLDTQAEVDAAFPDDAQFDGNAVGRFWKWLNKKTKHWDAFGPRSPRGVAFGILPVPLLLVYALVLAGLAAFGHPLNWKWFIPFAPIPLARKWRPVPRPVVAFKGRGMWRMEKDGADDLMSATPKVNRFSGYYLSRCQYWTRWHVAIQWPLCLSIHWYKSADAVIPAAERGDRDGKIRLLYIGAKRDADAIYWLWGFYIGTNFK